VEGTIRGAHNFSKVQIPCDGDGRNFDLPFHHLPPFRAADSLAGTPSRDTWFERHRTIVTGSPVRIAGKLSDAELRFERNGPDCLSDGGNQYRVDRFVS
jgi:hypothetical protein